VLAISSTSQDYAVAKEIAQLVKEGNPKIITVLGGHHVSYLPESMSEEFDIGVLGEGEETFAELVRALLTGADIGQMPGLAFHHEGRVIVTPPRPQIVPIDSIPMPVREEWERVYTMSSRGCPYRCSFCTSSVFWGKTRFFSAEYVVAEIEHILEHTGANPIINIYDDLFVADKKRFEKIVSLLEDKGIVDKAAFTFSVRANMVDDIMCSLIKRMKNAGVSFGAESGSDRILGLMNKNTTAEMNQGALDTLSKHGIPANCSFIVGWPSETEEEVRKTYSFIVGNLIAGKLTTGTAINILMPMPGTPMWDYATDKEIIPKHGFDWNRLGIFASFRHSTIRNFSDWVDLRRENNSIYMNEHTLPQERLYEIMSEYEQAVM
jgi:anaerobic magnesium-protoporphyrin IX monomethyl ester cyclase